MLERIDGLLGRPSFDPHGDPIPNAAGMVVQPKLRALNSAQPHERGVIARITDQDAQFLRYAWDRGLVPGAAIAIQSSDPVGDSITVLLGKKPPTLGRSAAARILVNWENG